MAKISSADIEKAPEEVVEFSVKVRNHLGEEKIIRFSNIKNHISSSLSRYEDECNCIKKILFKLECFNYTTEIVDA